MTGFEVDLAAVGTTASVLSAAAESLSVAVNELTGCTGLGPGRLDGAVDELVADTRRELTGVLRAVAADAALVESVLAGYAELDDQAAAELRGGDRR